MSERICAYCGQADVARRVWTLKDGQWWHTVCLNMVEHGEAYR